MAKILRVVLEIEMIDLPADQECVDADLAAGRRVVTTDNVTAAQAAEALKEIENFHMQQRFDALPESHCYCFGATTIVEASFNQEPA
jgi:hypothetical protein